MRLQSFKPPPLTEHQIQTQAIHALAARGWCTVRLNSGAQKVGNRFVRFYMIHGLAASSGLPDVLAWKDSRYLMLEIKDAKGKLTESQLKFHAWAARFGVTVHVVRSWQQVVELVEALD